MAAVGITRSLHSQGRWELRAGGASFVYERAAPGVLLLTVTGIDRGQFGSEPLREISAEIDRQGSLHLFVNAKAAVAVWPHVSREWTQFFWRERARLRRVSVLVGSRAIGLTIEIAQHLARTGNLVQIYSDEELFKQLLEASAAGAATDGPSSSPSGILVPR